MRNLKNESCSSFEIHSMKKCMFVYIDIIVTAHKGKKGGQNEKKENTLTIFLLLRLLEFCCGHFCLLLPLFLLPTETTFCVKEELRK